MRELREYILLYVTVMGLGGGGEGGGGGGGGGAGNIHSFSPSELIGLSKLKNFNNNFF